MGDAPRTSTLSPRDELAQEAEQTLSTNVTHIFGRTPSAGTYFVADCRGERLDLTPEEARIVVIGLTDMLEEDGIDG